MMDENWVWAFAIVFCGIMTVAMGAGFVFVFVSFTKFVLGASWMTAALVAAPALGAFLWATHRVKRGLDKEDSR